jgi:hypothetical protein
MIFFCCFYDFSVPTVLVYFCFCFPKLTYYRRQQPITDEQEMNTEENKEPQHEDVVKDDGSKFR